MIIKYYDIITLMIYNWNILWSNKIIIVLFYNNIIDCSKGSIILNLSSE